MGWHIESRCSFDKALLESGLQGHAGLSGTQAMYRRQSKLHWCSTMEIEEKNYLWQHFVFNAEQRLKAFNFFVILSVFANGGVFAAAEKNLHGVVFILIGGFVVVSSVVFWMIDARSQELLQLAVPGLKEFEKQFPEHSRLFARDSLRPKYVRYTYAFRALFALQLIFGLGAMAYGAFKWS